MRLLKPSWVSHDGSPIFSLDIHPDGSRLATGGQGEDCGRVVIWNMAPIINAEDEKDENVPKMLCQMDNHLACVNCVRWSNNGRYLASGGDDKVIMIWQTGRYPSGSAVFGSGGKVNVEQWRCGNTLRGHSGDILDLAWSPHDAWLASCSVDNTVIVWNAIKFPEMLSMLRGHSGLVKGVSWDPVGKYLASQSDDKRLLVWRTLDWQQEITITEPFEECGGTTHVLRLSWSPDGQYLVSAHAMNNSGPTAQIIDRDGWKTEKDFVGHRKAITVAKFNPNIFSKPVKDGTKMQNYCCCAIGSRDRSLSVWLTALKRPLVVIHDLFANSVMDISWSRKGYQLIVCSWDGTVAYVDFSVEEIGRSLTAEEHSAMHQRLYGKSLAMTNRTDSTTTIIENPDVLKLKEQLKDKEQTDHQRQQESVKSTVAAKGPINKQIETRTADGRRRITPMFIAPAPDLRDAPLPFSSKSQPTFSSSTESKSKIIIEKRDEVVSINSNSSPASSRPPPTTQTLSPKSPAVQSGTVTPITTPLIANATAATTTSGATAENANKTPSNSTVPTEQVKAATVEKADVVAVPVRTAEKVKEVKQLKVPDSSSQLKRKIDLEDGVKPVKRRPGRPALSEREKQTPVTVATPKTVPVVVVDKPAREVARSSHPCLHLPAIKVEKFLSTQVQTGKPETSMFLELDNGIQASATLTVHKLKCTVGGGKYFWEVLLHSKGVAMTGSSCAIAVVSEDNSLSIFSTSGQRMFPSVVLPAAVYKLQCSDHHIMVITSKAHVLVWDVKNQRNVVKNESLHPIMSGGGSDLSIVSSSLTADGCPVISLSSGKAYMFSKSMASWMMMSNADDIIQQYSDHQSYMPAQTIFNGSLTPLATLQAQGRKSSQQATRLFRSLPAVQQASTLTYLDTQLAAAFNLHSSKEYKFWLLALTQYLTQEGIELRLREICNNLLGPPQKSSKSSWESYTLGLHKHDLLHEILLIISTNLKLQRLFTEYQEQLDRVKT